MGQFGTSWDELGQVGTSWDKLGSPPCKDERGYFLQN